MHDATPTDSTGAGGDCKTGKRNRFFREKHMRVEEYETEQGYFLERRRRINRGVLGWGVVYGFALTGPRGHAAPCPDGSPAPPESAPAGQASPSGVQQAQQSPAGQAPPSAPPGKLSVGPGFALDPAGREIVIVDATEVGPKNAFLLVTGGSGCQTRPIEQTEPGRYVLAVHYAERQVEDSNVIDPCGCGLPEKKFVCETAVFSLIPLEKECPCEEKACNREYACTSVDSCCSVSRGPHACLCQWVTGAVPKGGHEVCEWNGYRITLEERVPLACVTVVKTDDKCAPLNFSIDDDCGPRRLVKNNDLLYDLIRGCDLTRIESISWRKWHRREERMPWAEFVDLLGPNVQGASEDAPRVTNLVVTFTGPVNAATVTPDCFSLSFIVTGEDTGWFERRIVHLPEVRPSGPQTGDPPGTTREVALCVDSGWYQEVTSHAAKLKKEGATVQIEVFGDFILDCHGQAVDANARGFALFDSTEKGTSTAMSGNGAPGGTLMSVFRIDQRSPAPKTAS